jgi:hypothetical protein
MLASVSCKVVESIAKISRLSREMNPLCFPYSVNPGLNVCRWLSICQYKASATAGSRVRFAFEKVLRAGADAPRTRILPSDTVRRFYDAWDYDFLWGTHDGFVDWNKAGRCTDNERVARLYVCRRKSHSSKRY